MIKRMTIAALAAGAMLGAGSGIAAAGTESPCWNGCSVSPSVLLPHPYLFSTPLPPTMDPIPNTGILPE